MTTRLPRPGEAWRILLADDHRVVREGLRALIERQDGMEVVGEAENGRQAVALAGELSADLVVMDIAMPDLNGFEATRRIAAQGRSRVIALSMHGDRRSVARMLKAGASGYVLKDTAFEELARAIQEVAAGRTYISPRVADVVVAGFVRESPAAKPMIEDLLTPRELEVLQLIAEGLSTKQIAGRLGVSAKTVGTHRAHLMEKLKVESVAELTRCAIREGLTPITQGPGPADSHHRDTEGTGTERERQLSDG